MFPLRQMMPSHHIRLLPFITRAGISGFVVISPKYCRLNGSVVKRLWYQAARNIYPVRAHKVAHGFKKSCSGDGTAF